VRDGHFRLKAVFREIGGWVGRKGVSIREERVVPASQGLLFSQLLCTFLVSFRLISFRLYESSGWRVLVASARFSHVRCLPPRPPRLRPPTLPPPSTGGHSLLTPSLSTLQTLTILLLSPTTTRLQFPCPSLYNPTILTPFTILTFQSSPTSLL
jgi:hypothetical protein